MTEKEFIKLANKILYVKQTARTPFGGKKSELKGLKKLYKAINYTHCCESDSEQLKDKVKLTFKNWLFSNEIRYVSEHNYKSNEGDIYNSDELEKMYQHYLSL